MAGQPSNARLVDISSSAPQLPPPSSHRLPTISASQALHDVQSNKSRALSTGVYALDNLLLSGRANEQGGFEKGRVTEIWGPSGSGKTALALQAAVDVLNDGRGVMWVDCAASISGPRLDALLSTIASRDGNTQFTDSLLESFHHTALPSLAHLLSLLLHPHPSFPGAGTSLLVLENLHTLLDLAYPRFPPTPPSSNHAISADQRKWLAGRRWAVLGNVASALKKAAVVHDLAVVVTTGCATRMRGEQGLGAALVPGVGGAEWEGGVWARLATMRDFNGRFVGVQKAQGQLFAREAGDVGKALPFEIRSADGAVRERGWGSGGDAAAAAKAMQETIISSPAKARKRAYDEIADSEEEDADEYGWAEGDEDAMATGAFGSAFCRPRADVATGDERSKDNEVVVTEPG